MINRYLTSILIALALMGCHQEGNKKEEMKVAEKWRLIYRNDKNGNAVVGSKNELISLARKGCPIKIGWASRRRNDTTKTVEHMIDAEFLTIANGNEVFAQVKPFLGQRPDLTSDTLSMTMLPIQLNWVLSTNGLISSVNIDWGKDTVKALSPKPFGHNLSWFAKTTNLSGKSKPLWD